MNTVGIDPSGNTGYADIGNDKLFEIAKDDEDYVKRARAVVDELDFWLGNDDIVCIEDFAYGAKGQAVSFQFGLGFMIRDLMNARGIKYYEVTTGELKKFCGASGNAKKEEMILPIYKRWGFEHKSDNVRDAYILSRIAQAITEGPMWCAVHLTKPQIAIVEAVTKRRDNPTTKNKAKKTPTRT